MRLTNGLSSRDAEQEGGSEGDGGSGVWGGGDLGRGGGGGGGEEGGTETEQSGFSCKGVTVEWEAPAEEIPRAEGRRYFLTQTNRLQLVLTFPERKPSEDETSRTKKESTCS
jgi:hypothetical protein